MFSIDLRKTIIPFSLLQIVNHFKRMQTGDTIEVLGIEEDIIADLKNVLPGGKFELLDVESMNTDKHYFRLWLKKIDTFNPQPKENCHV
ncbi:MAG: hypothetical protein WBG37_08295 [Desulfobacterales bacterium]|jgi:TusA-related sulfurtransferase